MPTTSFAAALGKSSNPPPPISPTTTTSTQQPPPPPPPGAVSPATLGLTAPVVGGNEGGANGDDWTTMGPRGRPLHLNNHGNGNAVNVNGGDGYGSSGGFGMRPPLSGVENVVGGGVGRKNGGIPGGTGNGNGSGGGSTTSSSSSSSLTNGMNIGTLFAKSVEPMVKALSNGVNGSISGSGNSSMNVVVPLSTNLVKLNGSRESGGNVNGKSTSSSAGSAVSVSVADGWESDGGIFDCVSSDADVDVDSEEIGKKSGGGGMLVGKGGKGGGATVAAAGKNAAVNGVATGKTVAAVAPPLTSASSTSGKKKKKKRPASSPLSGEEQEKRQQQSNSPSSSPDTETAPPIIVATAAVPAPPASPDAMQLEPQHPSVDNNASIADQQQQIIYNSTTATASGSTSSVKAHRASSTTAAKTTTPRRSSKISSGAGMGVVAAPPESSATITPIETESETSVVPMEGTLEVEYDGDEDDDEQRTVLPTGPPPASGGYIPLSICSFNTFLLPSIAMSPAQQAQQQMLQGQGQQQNGAGVAAALVSSSPPDSNGKKGISTARAERIADFCRGIHVCLLQEVWGPGVDILTTALTHTHGIPSALKSTKVPLLTAAVNTIAFYLAATGGLWVAYSKVKEWDADESRAYYDVTATNPTTPPRNIPKYPPTRRPDPHITLHPIPLTVPASRTFSVSATRSRKGIRSILLDASEAWGPGRKLLCFDLHLDA
ncbi:hypothetical protein HDU76_005801, partial [Blyttiomyces sp. JEL0837]